MEFKFNKIKAQRKQEGISINFILNKMKISRKTYWLWENGRRKPSEDQVRLLAKILNVELSDICDIKQEKEKSKIDMGKLLPSLKGKHEILYSNITTNLLKLYNQYLLTNNMVNLFFSTIKAAYYIKDVNQYYVKVNDLFLNFLNVDEDYAIGKLDLAFFSKEEAKINTAEDESVLKSGEIISNREGFIPGTRLKKIGLISKHPIYDQNSKIVGVVGIFYDITQLKKAETENKLLRTAIDKIDELIWVSKANANTGIFELLYFNKACYELLGISKETFSKNPEIYLDYISESDKDEYLAYLNNTNYPKTISYSIRSQNKTIFLKETAFEENNVNFGTICDITDQIEKHKSSGILTILLDSLDKSITVINLTTHEYIYMNLAKEKLYERNREEFVQKGTGFWFDLCVAPTDRERVKAIYSDFNDSTDIGENEIDFEYTFMLLTPSGKLKSVKSKTIIKKLYGEIYSMNIDSEVKLG